MGRLKPKYKHKNSGKAMGFKDPEYLEYMHNSNKKCIICGSREIELHHLKFNGIIGRDDRLIVELCPEHHRGSELSPHGAPFAFYNKISKHDLILIASMSYEVYMNDKNS